MTAGAAKSFPAVIAAAAIPEHVPGGHVYSAFG